MSTAARIFGLVGFVLTVIPPLKISWYWLGIHKRKRNTRDSPEPLRRRIEEINSSIAETLGQWSVTDHYMLVTGITLQFVGGLVGVFVCCL